SFLCVHARSNPRHRTSVTRQSCSRLSSELFSAPQFLGGESDCEERGGDEKLNESGLFEAAKGAPGTLTCVHFVAREDDDVAPNIDEEKSKKAEGVEEEFFDGKVAFPVVEVEEASEPVCVGGGFVGGDGKPTAEIPGAELEAVVKIVGGDGLFGWEFEK